MGVNTNNRSSSLKALEWQEGALHNNGNLIYIQQSTFHVKKKPAINKTAGFLFPFAEHFLELPSPATHCPKRTHAKHLCIREAIRASANFLEISRKSHFQLPCFSPFYGPL